MNKIEKLKLNAEKGNAQAQLKLGVCYAQGIGVEKNEKEAVRLWKLAAEQGLAQARNSLGMYYEHGMDVEKDEKKAKNWFDLLKKKLMGVL